MDKIEQEKDYIILLSISRYGYAAMPQNYNFLSRHTMLDIYYAILKSYTAGVDIKHLDIAVKQQAALQLKTDIDIDALREYKLSHGNKETKKLLDNNIFYWKVLLSELKKKCYEYYSSNPKNGKAT